MCAPLHHHTMADVLGSVDLEQIFEHPPLSAFQASATAMMRDILGLRTALQIVRCLNRLGVQY